LPSTPKHIYLYEVFGWEKPIYVHLPTVLNKDRKKLSKRQGDVSVEDFRDKGYLPEGLINYLALVGWSPEDNQEILSMEELIEKFSFERVSKTGGIFDKDKLNWVNGHYIRSASVERITDMAIPYLIEVGFIDNEFAQNKYEWLKLLIHTVQESLDTMAQVVEKVEFIFKDHTEIVEEDALEIIKGEQVKTVLTAVKEELSNIEEIDGEYAKGFMKLIQKATGVKGKSLFMPARVALTGTAHGPEFVNILVLLGKENILKRIDYVIKNYI